MGPLLGSLKILLLAQAMQGTVVGRVWDAETAEPVAGAVITLSGLNRATATDDTGRYEFQHVPEGQQELTVHFIGFARRTLHALVPREGQLEIDVWLLAEPVRINTIEERAPVTVRGFDMGAGAAF